MYGSWGKGKDGENFLVANYCFVLLLLLILHITKCGQYIRTVFESRYLGNSLSQKLFARLIGKLPISGMT
jgi:hypothetical protein